MKKINLNKRNKIKFNRLSIISHWTTYTSLVEGNKVKIKALFIEKSLEGEDGSF